MTSYRGAIWTFGNHVFQPGDLDLWPMTLTFELIRDIIKVNASTKFRVCMSNGSAMRALTDRQTHTHTQTGPILYPRPLTREGINLNPRNVELVNLKDYWGTGLCYYWFFALWSSSKNVTIAWFVGLTSSNSVQTFPKWNTGNITLVPLTTTAVFAF